MRLSGTMAACIVALGMFGCSSGDDERVEELEAEVAQLEGDLETAEAAQEAAEAAQASAEAERDTLQGEVDTLTGENESITAERDALQSDYDELEGSVTALEDDLAMAQTTIGTLTMDNEALTAEKESVEEYAMMLEMYLSPPPAFFDDLYPPVAAQPTLILEMFGLAGTFEGLIVDLTEGDFANLDADMAAFKASYENMRTNVIPELQDMMPMQPVLDLETAVATGDPAQIGPAIGPVGAVCGQCHGTYGQQTRMHYQWRDFDSIMVDDPIAGQPVEWHDYMMSTALQFNGIGHNLAQGQLDAARANFTAFESYYNGLEAGCTNCHNTPRQYYVSDDVDGMVAALGAELQNASPDPATVGGLMGGIGQMSCGGCHNLHQPTQLTKGIWETVETIGMMP